MFRVLRGFELFIYWISTLRGMKKELVRVGWWWWGITGGLYALTAKLVMQKGHLLSIFCTGTFCASFSKINLVQKKNQVRGKSSKYSVKSIQTHTGEGPQPWSMMWNIGKWILPWIDHDLHQAMVWRKWSSCSTKMFPLHSRCTWLHSVRIL